MALTDAGLRGRAIDKLAKAKKQIIDLKYDDAQDTLMEAWDILKVLEQKK